MVDAMSRAARVVAEAVAARVRIRSNMFCKQKTPPSHDIPCPARASRCGCSHALQPPGSSGLPVNVLLLGPLGGVLGLRKRGADDQDHLARHRPLAHLGPGHHLRGRGVHALTREVEAIVLHSLDGAVHHNEARLPRLGALRKRGLCGGVVAGHSHKVFVIAENDEVRDGSPGGTRGGAEHIEGPLAHGLGRRPHAHQGRLPELTGHADWAESALRRQQAHRGDRGSRGLENLPLLLLVPVTEELAEALLQLLPGLVRNGVLHRAIDGLADGRGVLALPRKAVEVERHGVTRVVRKAHLVAALALVELEGAGELLSLVLAEILLHDVVCRVGARRAVEGAERVKDILATDVEVVHLAEVKAASLLE
mmetsp:Transcript_44666/g.142221  ORF Transcript_44666/g.142221 Transcript_44666/m.142221 type:complete len:366 (+) Transcript_44666:99-1196(+)